jgi:glycosyltransferase involved in cell wall biosynthesis
MSVFVYCKLMSANYILDTHPPAFYSKKWRWSVSILRYFAKYASINITDQERFKQLYETWGARAIILSKPSRLVRQSNINQILPPKGEMIVTVVNTFAPDEPLEPILRAAEQLPNYYFYITGDTIYADRNILTNKTKNVIFTGYLLNDEYWNQLEKSRVVMVLTTYPHSLLAGAQDAMDIGKPMILSKQPVLTEYFSKGVIFVENTTKGIVDGLLTFCEKELYLIQEVPELLLEKQAEWDENYMELLNLIGRIT